MIFSNGGSLQSGTPGGVAVFGGFVNLATGVGSNTIVPSSTYFPSTNATSGATGGVGSTLSPVASRVPVVIFPTAAYAPQVSPAPNNLVFMLDLRGFPADIASVQLQYCPPPGANGGLPSVSSSANAQVLMIDNVNKFVYGTVMANGGGNAAVQSGAGVSFVVYFKDAFVP